MTSQKNEKVKDTDPNAPPSLYKKPITTLDGALAPRGDHSLHVRTHADRQGEHQDRRNYGRRLHPPGPGVRAERPPGGVLRPAQGMPGVPLQYLERPQTRTRRRESERPHSPKRPKLIPKLLDPWQQSNLASRFDRMEPTGPAPGKTEDWQDEARDGNSLVQRMELEGFRVAPGRKRRIGRTS